MATVDVLKYYLELDSKRFTAGAAKADAATKKLTSSIGDKLTTAVKGMVGAWLGWRALNIAGDLIEAGAKAERVGAAWQNLAASMGLNANKMLAQLKESARGTISEVDLMVQASRASVMGLPLEDLPRLMEISRAAAKAFGQSTSYMFESIVLGIARQSRLILDNLGIIISEEEVYKRETERLGRALTDAEKKQAFFNEALKQGGAIIDKVGEDVEDTTDQIESLTAAWQDFKAEIGKTLAESGIVKVFQAVFKAITYTYTPEWIKRGREGKKVLEGWVEELKKATQEATTFTMTVWGQAPEKAFETSQKIEEIYYELGMRNLDQMVSYYERELELYKENAKIKEQIEKRLAQLRDDLLRRSIKLEMVGLRGLPGIRHFTRATMPTEAPFQRAVPRPDEAIAPLMDRIVFEIREKLGEALDLWEGMLDGVVGYMSTTAQRIYNLGKSLMAGDWYSFGFNALSLAFDTLGLSSDGAADSAYEQARAIEAVNAEIERNIDAARRLTITQREERIKQLEQDLAYWTYVYNAHERIYEQTEDWLWIQLQGWQKELDMLFGNIADFDVLQGISSFIELLQYLSGMGDLDYETAQQIAQHFAAILDLSIEQQIELWEAILEILQANGNVTEDQLWAIEEMLHDLYEQQEEQQLDYDRGSRPESQVMRSITMVTERQANLMVSVLNSIYLTLREFLDSFREFAAGFDFRGRTFGGGGGTVNISVAGNSSQQIAESVNREFRARGIKVG